MRIALCVVAALTLMLVGCKSGSPIVPATSHAPSDPKSIKFYEKAPAKYEVLGVINLSIAPGASWDDRGNANKGFQRFREEAAAKGANGVLLQAEPGKTNLLVLAGEQGTMYHVPMYVDGEKRTAIGQAIFVIEEE